MTYGVLVVGELRRHDFDNKRLALVRTQFSDKVYLCLKNDVILYQSRSSKHVGGYFAVATLLDADVSARSEAHLSLTFAQPIYFEKPMPVHAVGPIVESYIRNAEGKLHSRRVAEDFRIIPEAEFDEIVAGKYFPNPSPAYNSNGLSEAEDRIRQRVAQESWLRSIKARAIALPIYKFQCAITHQKLLSLDGLRSGLEVCHAKSVADGGPDVAANLVPLCPDFHKRYDQGTIDILDDYTWVPIGRNHDAVITQWQGSRELFVPEDPANRLNPAYLAAHREEVFSRCGVVL